MKHLKSTQKNIDAANKWLDAICANKTGRFNFYHCGKVRAAYAIVDSSNVSIFELPIGAKSKFLLLVRPGMNDFYFGLATNDKDDIHVGCAHFLVDSGFSTDDVLTYAHTLVGEGYVTFEIIKFIKREKR